MQLLIDAGLLLLGYFLGSIPFGLIIVKLRTGKDLRSVESGRTGGTNAMRAGGALAGLGTGIMDALKGALAVWVAQAIDPSNQWIHILAPVGAILGHNYSVFMIERDEEGHIIRLRGGAGGGPAFGGAFGLWAPSFFFLLPINAAVFFLLGYASATTMSIGLSIIVVFGIRAYLGLSPWLDVVYGILAEILLLWSLRPNIKKLVNGTERVVSISLHGRLKAKRENRVTE